MRVLMTAAHIMFFASNICCVNSGTVNARYCWEPRDVSGANPFMKKCSRGNGTLSADTFRCEVESEPHSLKNKSPIGPELTTMSDTIKTIHGNVSLVSNQESCYLYYLHVCRVELSIRVLIDFQPL